MVIPVNGKSEFLTLLEAALIIREDTHFELTYNGARLTIHGTKTVERLIQEQIKQLEGQLRYQTASFKMQERMKDRKLKDLRTRLNNPQRVFNRFKQTPAAMWGGR